MYGDRDFVTDLPLLLVTVRCVLPVRRRRRRPSPRSRAGFLPGCPRCPHPSGPCRPCGRQPPVLVSYPSYREPNRRPNRSLPPRLQPRGSPRPGREARRRGPPRPGRCRPPRPDRPPHPDRQGRPGCALCPAHHQDRRRCPGRPQDLRVLAGGALRPPSPSCPQVRRRPPRAGPPLSHPTPTIHTNTPHNHKHTLEDKD